MQFDDEHLDALHQKGYKISVLEYVYLEQVSRLQRSKSYGFWCVMPNSKFCHKLKISDKGLRKLQDRMIKLGLLEKGTGSRKRALPTFTDWRKTEQSTEEEQSTDRNLVPSKSELSTDQKRNLVPKKTELSTDKPKEPKKNLNKPKTELPFSSSSFQNSWNEWLQYRKQIRKKMTPITIKRQLGKLAKYKEGEAVAMIEQSMEKGWSGLFEVKDNKVDWKALNDTGL